MSVISLQEYKEKLHANSKYSTYDHCDYDRSIAYKDNGSAENMLQNLDAAGALRILAFYLEEKITEMSQDLNDINMKISELEYPNNFN
ncbi:hypothetical protein [Methylobacterium oxalidis]|uniref:Uncharacterized protein n=1 Tax=Methylobacterium oxalidis TaxID=944322 RepID=A0A512JC47_9HYPH|nr:hypothetical protein [Methylobacterium oxalidis]GEP07527.1 hypothetical protein MOX02_55650 [Methylobacterium oxalidis]GJE35611.1 hypothetical protein LDDCCGHA_5830 [Methylobacterium oxalidis]GLS65767.1 hypothetical protein GCM10007888_41490 [Methylobacterium oxalidis]